MILLVFGGSGRCRREIGNEWTTWFVRRLFLMKRGDAVVFDLQLELQINRKENYISSKMGEVNP